MAYGLIQNTTLQSIADAIRQKNESSDTYKPGEMAAAILAITTGEPDWTELGYEEAPSEIINAFTYAKNIKEGKNLFDISQISSGSVTGVDYTVNTSTGVITVSGESTGSGWKSILNFTLPEVGTYHFHLERTGNVGYFLEGFSSLGTDVTVVCTDVTTTYRLALNAFAVGTTYEGTISKIQIEKGNQYTGYAPYCKYTNTTTYINDKNMFFFPNIDLLSRYNCSNMFDKSNLMHCPPLTLGSLESGAGNITTNYMFRQTWIEEIELSTVNNNTQTINLNNTFYDCVRLKKAKFNAPVSFGEGVFNGCTSLTDLTFASTPTCGQTRYIFRNCSSLVTAPALNTTGITLATEMFKGDTLLENVPIYDFSSVTNMQNAFQNCPALSDTSLDNILVMSINATAFSGNKTLAYWGIANTYDSRITALPHYQDFIDAGWVIR